MSTIYKCDTGIVCACNADAFEHGVYGLGFPRFQKDLRSAHTGGMFGYRHRIIRLDGAGGERVED